MTDFNRRFAEQERQAEEFKLKLREQRNKSNLNRSVSRILKNQQAVITREVLQQDDTAAPQCHFWFQILYYIALFFMFVFYMWGLVVTTEMVWRMSPNPHPSGICTYLGFFGNVTKQGSGFYNDGKVTWNFKNHEITLMKIFTLTSILFLAGNLDRIYNRLKLSIK